MEIDCGDYRMDTTPILFYTSMSYEYQGRDIGIESYREPSTMTSI